LQVRQEPALGFVVGVGNIVSDHWAFARYVADACHVDTPILLNSRCLMSFTMAIRRWLVKLKALQPHLARRVAVTHFDEMPRGQTQQSLGL